MRVSHLRTATLLLTLAASSSALAAGVVLRMKWGNPQKTCVITTDQNGLAADPNTGELSFTGTQAATDCPGGNTGGGGGGGGTVPDPVITNALDASELPATVSLGTTTTVSWAADADTCTYAGSSFPVPIANWPTSGAGMVGCSSAAGCAANHPVSVAFPQAGTYTFKLTCSKTGAVNQAVSTRTVVVPAPPTTGCIAPAGLTRLLSGTVRYNSTNSGQPRVVDLTRFENVFGHDQITGATRPFPGTRNLTQRIVLPKGTYAALQFTVPANFNSQTQGMYSFEESATHDRPSVISMTISKTCGDFNVTPTAPMTSRCVLSGGALNSSLLWGNVGALTSRCQLEANQTYYLNILYASLASPTTTGCNITGCSAPIFNRQTSEAAGNIWQGAPAGGSSP